TVCLGTMTFGEQNTQAEASEQLDYAVGEGINFIDTAELYSVPPRRETYGDTERMIGNWLAANPAKRQDIIIASKLAGRGLAWIREGDLMKGKYVESSIDASLQRLQTDYIDLYQLHWPNRPHPGFNRHWFGKLDFNTMDKERELDDMLGILQALDKAIKAGKIRYVGLSNETPWGIEQYMRLATEHNLPRMVSIQNEFSLIQTKDYPFVAESCHLNDLAYLPWSPLGSGVLSGKYRNGVRPQGSRWTLAGRHGNFRNQPLVHEAVEAYLEVAGDYGLTISELSLAWCHQLDWVTSTIIGATKMEQLKENINAFKVELSEEAVNAINAVAQRYAVPYA
ncbi:MAG: aldo/keto reductase, partial [Bacteroidota bacterium]